MITYIIIDPDRGVQNTPFLKGAIYVERKDYGNYRLTPFCKNSCTPEMIIDNSTHLYIWNHFITTGKTKAIVIMENSKPNNNFKHLTTFMEYVPDGWEFLYLGSGGSCESKFSADYLVSKGCASNSENVEINDYVIKPAFPLLHGGYMITKRGAKKMLACMDSSVDYYLGYQLGMCAANGNLKTYAFKDKLFYRDHPNDGPKKLLTDMANVITGGYNSKYDNRRLGNVLSTPIMTVHKCVVTSWTVLLFFLGILVGITSPSSKGLIWWTAFNAFLQSLEAINLKYTFQKHHIVRSMLLEFLLAMVGYWIGTTVSRDIQNGDYKLTGLNLLIIGYLVFSRLGRMYVYM
uniref:Uncharacterized protein n=1 Tax=viral metagenome TaxID=1070528 RepID=A0A6C0CMN7_9ZZZZ